jgi:hypothetical protein
MNLEKRISVEFYDLPLIAATRVALGAGIGLLVADRLSPSHRKQTGQMLLWFGLLSTFPIVLKVFSDAGWLSCHGTTSPTSEGRNTSQVPRNASSTN